MKIHKTLFLFLIGILLISGCTKDDPTSGEPETIIPTDSNILPARGFFMGMLPTISNGQSFDDAYIQVAQYSEFVPVWGRPTPFYNLATDLNGWWGETFVQQLIRGNSMFPIIHLSFIGSEMTLVTPPGMENATLSDLSWREAYKQAAIDVVKTSKPLYLSIGNEVNRWYEDYGTDDNNSNGFQHFVSLYEEIYDAVKDISPKTKVFCTFAREIVSENREADLSVLQMFPSEKIDILVFTSYPYAVQGINIPNDIPDDYYSRISNYISNKPFGFSELGWPSMDAFGGEQGQADFIIEASSRLTRNQGIELHLFGWAWLHDLDENDAIGLINTDGTEKLGYNAWKNLSDR